MKDRTISLFSASVVLAFVSYFAIVTSVHTYCENRVVIGFLAAALVGLLIYFFRNRAASLPKKIISSFGIAISIAALTFNLWFIAWATKTCAHQFDLLKGK
jgi:hypothetical protein